MGMYTGLAFKAIIKPEFRKYKCIYTPDLSDYDYDGLLYWMKTDVEKFTEFGKNDRSCMIPTGYSAYFDDYLYDDTMDIDVQQAHPSYNEETGEWQVYCSLKNYDHEIEKFFELMPYFIEKCDRIYYKHEYMSDPWYYKLENGKIVQIED